MLFGFVCCCCIRFWFKSEEVDELEELDDSDDELDESEELDDTPWVTLLTPPTFLN